MKKHVAMWSGPRNLSTALMYSFRQRPDTEVVDEPLYGYYLAHTGLDHPGRKDVLEAMETDPRRVIETVFAAGSGRPVRFTKNMAHHLVDLDLGFIDTLANVLLTRHPAGVLPSLQANVPDAGVEATGLPMQMAILDRIEAAGDEPVVLDAAEVLQDPPAVLAELCGRLYIPYTDAMLHWPAGPKPEDGVWAGHWYGSAHRSAGFGPPRPDDDSLPHPLLDRCLPMYRRLRALAIRA